MSIPVRYSAAANYEYAAAVVESGLNNTLNQEEQYHLQQQLEQQYQQQQDLYANQLYNINRDQHSFGSSVLRQQQLMQQRSSMSSSLVAPSLAMPLNEQQQQHAASQAEMSGQIAGDGFVDNTEMQTEWMSDEGRYGTPGAAGLEYQKFAELQEQQERTTPNNVDNQPMEPLLMDNENRNVNMNMNASNSNSSSANTALSKLEEELFAMSEDELLKQLKEYDTLQRKYHTVLLLPRESKREVTAGGRDGSAYVLRCLKMWYELPSDVLFSAMSLMDRFLDRMTVKPKHMACLSVASFHLAIKQWGQKEIPAEDLVTISQCGCTPGDLERMANVINNKVGMYQMGQAPITSVSFLRLYYALFRNCAKDIGGPFFEFYQRFIKLEELENRLENLLCDVKTTVITPSVLALVLISLHLDFHIKASYTRGTPELKTVFNYILFLQQFLDIPDRVFTCGFSIVAGILSHYNGQNKQPYKQRLVWRLSTRTLRVLRPTKSFSSDLPTIEEGISNVMDDGCRSRTESVSSEDEEDWPTSVMIPIFE